MLFRRFQTQRGLQCRIAFNQNRLRPAHSANWFIVLPLVCVIAGEQTISKPKSSRTIRLALVWASVYSRLYFSLVSGYSITPDQRRQCQYQGVLAHRNRHRRGTRKAPDRSPISFAPLWYGYHRPAEPDRVARASAALPPITTTRLAFLMSTQWLVIAPRPNVGARRFATVGPCVRHAHGCRPRGIPSAREEFCVK